jgi:hypothetical protein
MGFIRKATIIGTGGMARAVGVRGTSKKERNAKANEKMAKIEGKRFKTERETAKTRQKAVKSKVTSVRPPVVVASVPVLTPTMAAAAPPQAPQAPQAPPPGWYLDPDGGSLQRWWDGTRWTEFKQAPAASQADPNDAGIIGSLVATVRPSTSGAPVPSRPLQSAQASPPVDTNPAHDLITDSAYSSQNGQTRNPEGSQKMRVQAKIEPGHLVCNEAIFRYCFRVLGRDHTRSEKLSKLGTGPIKVTLSKDGTLAMQLLPGLTLKGLTPDVCAADLAEIGTQRPDVPVEVSTPQVAKMLQSAQVASPRSES